MPRISVTTHNLFSLHRFNTMTSLRQRQIQCPARQAGLSLVEIQVALVIGLILTAGAIQLFIANKQTYRTEAALAQMQQLGRFAVDTMAQEIRMAGYTGCTSRETVTTNIDPAAPIPTFAIDGPTPEISGSEATAVGAWNPNLPAMAGIEANITNQANLINIQPDVLTVQRASQCGSQLTANSNATAPNLNVFSPNQCDFQANDALLVTDCTNMDIVQLANATDGTVGGGQVLTIAGALSKNYLTNADVYKLVSNTFYIAASASDPDAAGNPEPALWMSNWNPSNPVVGNYNPIEIADGVQDMLIQYGVDNGGPDEYADVYVAADQVLAANPALGWAAVRSVRISLLMRSADNITLDPVVFQFDNRPANPNNDRRLRAVYTTTVAIRNQLQ